MLFQRMKIIIIFCLILISIETIHTILDPKIAMCIDGEVDTAFLTQDGSTYIFMSSWFWKLKSDLSGVEGNASEISEYFKKLPENIETSFYMSGDKSNSLNGKTIFIKNSYWWSYENQQYIESGGTNWTDLPTIGDLLAIAQYNDPIVVFYVKHSQTFEPRAYYFDSYYYPESKDVVHHDIPFDTQETEALVSYSDGKYLIFFDDDKIGGHCIMTNARSGCVTNRLNSDLFECPDFTKNLFARNLFIKIWVWSGLGLKQFGILTFGVLLSLTFILIFLVFIMSLRVRKQYVKKCKNKK